MIKDKHIIYAQPGFFSLYKKCTYAIKQGVIFFLMFFICCTMLAGIAQADTSEADPCQSFGDLIRNTKVENAIQQTGNYARRADVHAFAQRVAACYQLNPSWVSDILAQANYQASTVKFIMPQPAGTRNWQNFRGSFLHPNRIRAGVRFWRDNQHLLERAQATYGVPPEIVMGILGVETTFGQVTGNFRIIDALATLSFDFPEGRSDRTDYFSQELAQFLAFAANQQIDPLSIRGSYAGAMGMPQFMPSSLVNYGVDFDQDGKIDLHNSTADIIGSVANYLAQYGWQAGLDPVLPVTLHSTTQQDIAALKEPDIVPSFTAEQMALHGVIVDTDVAHWPHILSEKLSFIILENGADNVPDYVAGTQNFFVITRYNRSSFYAMTVIELGRAIANARSGTTMQATLPSKRRP